MKHLTKFLVVVLVLHRLSVLAVGDPREIHVAYVDEELCSVLQALVHKELTGQKRPIIVIERGVVEQGALLFEKELSYYDPDFEMQVEKEVYYAGADETGSDPVTQRITDRLYEAYSKAKKVH